MKDHCDSGQLKMELEELQSWWEIPRISHFCSLFREAFCLADFDIEDLEKSLLDRSSEGNQLLIGLLCSLLNGCYNRRDIGLENYEKYLQDIFSYRLEVEQDLPNPLAKKSFFELTLRERVTLLNHLCDFRLDAVDVPEQLKGLRGDCMRVEPLGVDSKGAKYWYFYGTRLYMEEPVAEKDSNKKKPKGRKKKQKNQKIKKAKTSKAHGEDLEEEEDSENEASTQHLNEKEEEEDAQENMTKKRVARLRVSLERKGEEEGASDDEEVIGDGLDDGVESLKFDSSGEEEEAPFVDHSSDEDYSEKNNKKQKSGKKRKKTAGKTPDLDKKTPKGPTGRIPQILRHPPRSARLRAKFGLGRGKQSQSVVDTHDDNLSTASHSTTTSDTPKAGQARARKDRAPSSDASNMDDSNEAFQEKPSAATDDSKEELMDEKETAAEEKQLPAAETDLEKNGSAANDSEQMEEDANSVDAVSVDDKQDKAQDSEVPMDTGDETEHGIMPASNAQSVPEYSPNANCIEDEKETVSVERSRAAAIGSSETGGCDEDGDGNDMDLLHAASVKQEVVGEEACNQNSVDTDVAGEAKPEPHVPKTSIKQEDQKPTKETSESNQEADENKIPKKEDENIPSLMKTEKINSDADEKPCACKDPEDIKSSILTRKMVVEDMEDSQDSRSSSFSSKREENMSKVWEPWQPTDASRRTGWHLVCEVTQDWQQLVDTLADSKVRCDRTLLRILREEFLPLIPSIQEEKEKERKRREEEMAPRRQSTRLLYKKKEQADRDRILKEAEEEEEQLKALEEEERKRRQEEERREEQRRQKEERERAREERAKRVKLREERARLIAEGKEIPPELMNGMRTDSPCPAEDALDDEVVAKLHKVLAVCVRHEESWPFVESVEEQMAPDYYHVIKMPMTLNEMEDKLNGSRYSSKEEFEADMDLIVSNCETYNGEDHDFSIMARNIRTAFQQSMRRIFPVARSRKDDEDFVIMDKAVKVGKKMRARREASKRALNAFPEMLSDEAEELEAQTCSRPKALISNQRSFAGYQPGGSTSTAGVQQVKVVYAPTGQGTQPAVTLARTAAPLILRQGTSPQVRGGSPRVFVVPGSSASMVSLLKQPPGAAGEKGRTVFITVSQPQGARPVRVNLPTTATATSKSGVTQVLSTALQSGGTVRPIIAPAPGVIKSVTENAQPVSQSQGVRLAGSPVQAAAATSAGTSQGGSPQQTVMHISKDDLLRMMAEKKLTVVQLPDGRRVLRLPPGSQLTQKTVSPSQGKTAVAASPATGGGVAVTGATATPGSITVSSGVVSSSPSSVVVSRQPGISTSQGSGTVVQSITQGSAGSAIVVGQPEAPVSPVKSPSAAVVSTQSSLSSSVGSLIPSGSPTVVGSVTESNSVKFLFSPVSGASPSAAPVQVLKKKLVINPWSVVDSSASVAVPGSSTVLAGSGPATITTTVSQASPLVIAHSPSPARPQQGLVSLLTARTQALTAVPPAAVTSGQAHPADPSHSDPGGMSQTVAMSSVQCGMLSEQSAQPVSCSVLTLPVPQTSGVTALNVSAKGEDMFPFAPLTDSDSVSDSTPKTVVSGVSVSPNLSPQKVQTSPQQAVTVSPVAVAKITPKTVSTPSSNSSSLVKAPAIIQIPPVVKAQNLSSASSMAAPASTSTAASIQPPPVSSTKPQPAANTSPVSSQEVIHTPENSGNSGTAGSGRSRRNVVSHNYKQMAGFSSKSSSGRRKSEGGKGGKDTADVTVGLSVNGSCDEGKTDGKPRTFLQKRIADGGGDMPPSKVLRLDPDTSCANSGNENILTDTDSGPSGALLQTSLCNQENMTTSDSSQENHLQPQASSAAEDTLEDSQLDGSLRAESASALAVGKGGNAQCSELVASRIKTSSPRPKTSTYSAGVRSSKLPLKHADHNIVQNQSISSPVSTAEMVEKLSANEEQEH